MLNVPEQWLLGRFLGMLTDGLGGTWALLGTSRQLCNHLRDNWLDQGMRSFMVIIQVVRSREFSRRSYFCQLSSAVSCISGCGYSWELV